MEKLKKISKPPLVLIENGVEKTFDHYVALLDYISQRGRKGKHIQRYKGLGEMNPELLWETTMDPTRRRLLKVTFENASGADLIFSTLMGDQIDKRREFIEEHALDVQELDV